MGDFGLQARLGALVVLEPAHRQGSWEIPQTPARREAPPLASSGQALDLSGREKGRTSVRRAASDSEGDETRFGRIVSCFHTGRSIPTAGRFPLVQVLLGDSGAGFRNLLCRKPS